MRLFYTIDGTSQWKEITSETANMIQGDLLFCHKKSLQEELQGMSLMTGEHFPATTPASNNDQFEKQENSIVFFTKIPQSYSTNPYHGNTLVDVVFGPDWFESD